MKAWQMGKGTSNLKEKPFFIFLNSFFFLYLEITFFKQDHDSTSLG